MFDHKYLTVRVTPATNVPAVIERIRLMLSASESSALIDLLADTATRFQSELGNSGTHGETRLSLPGVTIRVSTAKETGLERVLNARLKNRTTFV